MAQINNFDIAKHIVSQIESGADTSIIARQLASLLIDERRTRDASALLRAVEAELNKRSSTQVTVTSAYELTNEVKQQLASILEVENPVYTDVIDSSVIGGAKARAGEKEIDLTVRAKLNNFKRTVAKGVN